MFLSLALGLALLAPHDPVQRPIRESGQLQVQTYDDAQDMTLFVLYDPFKREPAQYSVFAVCGNVPPISPTSYLIVTYEVRRSRRSCVDTRMFCTETGCRVW